MKQFFFLLLLSLYANADYLYTKTNKCVYDLAPKQDSKGWCYTKRSNDQRYCNSNAKYSQFMNGYVFQNGECNLKNDLKITGLTQNEWSYIMAILANVLGFIFLFLVGFSSLRISKKA